MIPEDIQEILRPCLWDAMVDQLDLRENKYPIIERLLEHGGDKQIEFLLATYDRESIAEVVRSSRYLLPKTVNYWCLRLGIKREDTRCFTRPFPTLWPPS